ncbi:hypothetical protein SAMN05216302_102139 [Nitrosomonas aestuarii]|uniref:Uncharacterized protein n=1 Tax=Nitrosomonas aestuarii TaxID=52441 RepID=A0A1I4DJM8_9PROT|nr:hypothetical protein [Nitrosomonas aestuarii]SFK92657.1 hypothetical protein SAMN05216302_102139 [Nitrosomonas aestuarii]
MSVLNKPRDYRRGYRLCDCGMKILLEAGFDYPKQVWYICKTCNTWAIDPRQEKSPE